MGRALLTALLLAALPLPLAAQGLPSEPVTLASGRIVLGGDASAAVATEDAGFFNYSDYEHSTLREVRLGLTASVRASDQISILGEIRSDNFTSVRPFALFARVRPWRNRRFDIQAGRIPPTFGAFTRRAYGHDNPLIGYPLAYQYLTSLRPDSVPANADELVRMRGRGWLSNFGVGNTTPERGLPLVSVFSWDTGVQVSSGWRALDLTASVTNGSMSNPRVEDDNDGKQVAARVAVRPMVGLLIGVSAARGEFIARRLTESIAPSEGSGSVQRAFGLDLELARDHWMVRSDAVLSDWTLPILQRPFVHNPLRAVSASVEGRYTILPGLYAAVRIDALAFNKVSGSSQTVPWDAAVRRVEVGAGYRLQRNVMAKFSVQTNWRDGGRVRRSTLPAVQLLYWF